MLASLDKFILLSVQLCGISSFDLAGTGYAKEYYETTESIVGAGLLHELLETFVALPQGPNFNQALRQQILADSKLGPIARSIMKLWYTAIWFELPKEWMDKFGRGPNKRFIPYTYAYPESLLGPAVGAHPQGAKPTGHQSWTLPPQCLPIPPECV